jgi:hypothetical protein
MLLHRSVWSFTNITFHVIHLEPTCPDFLFIIKDLTTIEEEVLKAVCKAWHDTATNIFLDAICNQVPNEARHQAEQSLLHFIDSMWIVKLDMKH